MTLYTFDFGEIWYYTNKSGYYCTNDKEDFQDKIDELEAVGAWYEYEETKKFIG